MAVSAVVLGWVLVAPERGAVGKTYLTARVYEGVQVGQCLMWLAKLINVPITASGVEPRWTDREREVVVARGKSTLKSWIVFLVVFGINKRLRGIGLVEKRLSLG